MNSKHGEWDFATTKESIYIYYEDEDILKKYHDILSKEPVDIKKISDSKYQGRVNIQSDNEYVLFTIPYDKGWSASVDGENAEIIQAQGELMAVKVGHGEHIIELSFIPSGFYLGLVVSVVGVFAFVALVCIKHFFNLRSKEIN